MVSLLAILLQEKGKNPNKKSFTFTVTMAVGSSYNFSLQYIEKDFKKQNFGCFSTHLPYSATGRGVWKLEVSNWAHIHMC